MGKQSNTKNGLAEKGSKYWMQKIANDKLCKTQLEKLLGNAPLAWISPLCSKLYKEYQLKEPDIMSKVLELEKKDFADKFSFWPSNGPHWDAIATSVDGSILYLFEAKSHLKEVRSKCSATNQDSINLIKSSMYKVYEKIAGKGKGDFSSWESPYYQLGNRLTFLYMMNQTAFPKIKEVKLVLLNIIDDKTHKLNMRVSQKAWEDHYDTIFMKMTGKKEAPKNVILLFFPVK